MNQLVPVRNAQLFPNMRYPASGYIDEIGPVTLETMYYWLTAHLFAIKMIHLVKTIRAFSGGLRVF
jgi:hypothetical protein